MKKQAFTLIELMGVIIILGIIALIAIPTVDRQLQQGKIELSEKQQKAIEMSTKLWAEDNKSKMPEDGDYCYIKYSELINSGYLQDDLKDISTGNVLNKDNFMIKIKKDSKYDKYSYEIVENVSSSDTKICSD